MEHVLMDIGLEPLIIPVKFVQLIIVIHAPPKLLVQLAKIHSS